MSRVTTWFDLWPTDLLASSDEPPAECDQGSSWVCEQVLEWSDGNESLARLLDTFGVAILFLVLTWLIARLSRRYVERLIRRVLAPDRLEVPMRTRPAPRTCTPSPA